MLRLRKSINVTVSLSSEEKFLCVTLTFLRRSDGAMPSTGEVVAALGEYASRTGVDVALGVERVKRGEGMILKAGPTIYQGAEEKREEIEATPSLSEGDRRSESFGERSS